MSDEMIVRHCSPTLAGIKTANLFSCSFGSKHHLNEQIRKLNKMFNPKGLRVLPLKVSENSALIYVYRPERLKTDLLCNQAEDILKSKGYNNKHPQRCLVNLIGKLRACEDFPHEIGLFLGYPPEDVKGFIENGAKNSKCTGCWKVYGDEKEAKILFSRYKRCTDEYLLKLNLGINIERLAVAV